MVIHRPPPSLLDVGVTMTPMVRVRGATVSLRFAHYSGGLVSGDVLHGESRGAGGGGGSLAWVQLSERRAALKNHSDAKAVPAELAVDMSMLMGLPRGDDDGDMEGDLYWQAVGGVAPEFVIVHSRELFLGFWKECQAAIAFLVMYSWFVVVGAFGMRAWCIRYIHNVLKWYGWIVLC